MKAKPKHLAPTYGAQFKEASVVEAYAFRPPYPDELFEILVDLMPGESRRVLDVGCGTGYLSRPLTQHASHVDAYIESFHSSNGFSRERMTPEQAAAFDTAVSNLVTPYCENNQMEIQVSGIVVWGKPHDDA